MSLLGLIKGGVMPSGKKNGTVKERMEYWQKVWIRSGQTNERAEKKFKDLRREYFGK